MEPVSLQINLNRTDKNALLSRSFGLAPPADGNGIARLVASKGWTHNKTPALASSTFFIGKATVNQWRASSLAALGKVHATYADSVHCRNLHMRATIWRIRKRSADYCDTRLRASSALSAACAAVVAAFDALSAAVPVWRVSSSKRLSRSVMAAS